MRASAGAECLIGIVNVPEHEVRAHAKISIDSGTDGFAFLDGGAGIAQRILGSKFVRTQRAKGMADDRRTDPLRVREVDHPHALLIELLLHRLPRRSLIPIIADKEYVELKSLPRLKLVDRLLRDRRVNPFYVADDLNAILERDQRSFVFVFDELIDGHAHDELVAQPARVLEQVEMPDVKQIVDAGGVSDDH